MDLKPIPESDQAAFFEGALSAALKAEAVTGAICVPIEVAGCRIELRFASSPPSATTCFRRSSIMSL